jgi:hypothetical protein
MKTARTLASLVLTVIAAGCETPPADGATASTSASPASHNCARETRTGSNLPSKDCAAAMSDAERQQAIENMRVKNPSTSTVRSSSGG